MNYEKKDEFPSSAKRFKTSCEAPINFKSKDRTDGKTLPIKRMSAEDRPSSIDRAKSPYQFKAARVFECEAKSKYLSISKQVNIERKKSSSSLMRMTKTVKGYTKVSNLQLGCDTRKHIPSSAQNKIEKCGPIPRALQHADQLPIDHIKVVHSGKPTSTGLVGKPKENKLDSQKQMSLTTREFNEFNGIPLNTTSTGSQTSAQIDSSTVHQRFNSPIFSPQHVCSYLPQLNSSRADLEASIIVHAPPQLCSMTQLDALTRTQVSSPFNSHNVCTHFPHSSTNAVLETSTSSQVPSHDNTATVRQTTTQTEASTSSQEPSQLNTSVFHPQLGVDHLSQFYTPTARVETLTFTQAAPIFSTSTIYKTNSQIKSSTILPVRQKYNTMLGVEALSNPQTASQINTSGHDDQEECPHHQHFIISTPRSDTSTSPRVPPQLNTDSQNVCPHCSQVNASSSRRETSPINQVPPQDNLSTASQIETSASPQVSSQLKALMNDCREGCTHLAAERLDVLTASKVPANSGLHQRKAQEETSRTPEVNPQIRTPTVSPAIAHSQIPNTAQVQNIPAVQLHQPQEKTFPETPIKQEKSILKTKLEASKASHTEFPQEGFTSSTKVEPSPEASTQLPHAFISQEGYTFASLPQAQATCSPNQEFPTSALTQMLIPRVECILTPQLQGSTTPHGILQSDKLTLGLQFEPTIFQAMFPQRQSYVFDSQIQASAVPRSALQSNERLLVSRIRSPATFRPVLEVSPQTNECVQSHSPPTTPATSLKSDGCIFGLQFQAPVVSPTMKNFIQPPGYYLSLQLQSSNEKVDPSKLSENHMSSCRLQVQKEEALPQLEKFKPSESNNTQNRTFQSPGEEVPFNDVPAERSRVVEDAHNVQIAAEALSLLKTSARVNNPLADQPVEIGISVPGLDADGQSLHNETIRLQLPRKTLENPSSPPSQPDLQESRSHDPLSLFSNTRKAACNEALQSRKTSKWPRISDALMQRSKSKYVSNQIAEQLANANRKKSKKHESKVQILDNVILKTANSTKIDLKDNFKKKSKDTLASATGETITSSSSLHMPDILDITLPLKPSSAHSSRKESLNTSPLQVPTEDLARMLDIPTRCQIPLNSIHLPAFAATGVAINASYFRERVAKKRKLPSDEKKFKSSSKPTCVNRGERLTSKSRIWPPSSSRIIKDEVVVMTSRSVKDEVMNSDQEKAPETKPSKYSLLAAATAFSALKRSQTTQSKTELTDISQAKPCKVSIPSLNTTRSVITPLVPATKLNRTNASDSWETTKKSNTMKDSFKSPYKKAVQSEGNTSNIPRPIPEKPLKTPLDAFTLLIDAEIIERIVKFTNARINDPTDKVELRAFLGLLLISGALNQNTMTIAEIWSECFGSGVHRATLQESRFKELSEGISFGQIPSAETCFKNNENTCIGYLWEQYLDNCKRYSLPLLHISSIERVSRDFNDGGDEQSGHICSTARRTMNMSLRILFTMLDSAGTRGLVMFCQRNPSIKITLRDFMKQVGMNLIRVHLRKRLHQRSLPTSMRDLIASILNRNNHVERDAFSSALVGHLGVNLECQLCSWKDSSKNKTRIQCYNCRRTMCKKHRTKLCTDCAKEL